MSNKTYTKINPLDTLIRQTLNLGMSDSNTYLQIEYLWGFELFNTRAYHNYETFSGGYRITDKHNDIRVQAEDLDDALQLWAEILTKIRAGEELNFLQRHAYKHLEAKKNLDARKET